MYTELIARNIIISALLIPVVTTASVVMTAEPSFAQQSASNGGNGGRGGESSPQGASSALDLELDCLTHVCAPPRRPKRPRPVESASIKSDCSCEMRTVRSGGRFIRVRDCYKVINNRLNYCEPLAQ